MNIQEKTIKIIAEFLDLETTEVTLESNLKEDLGADSLDFAELVMELEDEFEFEAEEEALAEIKTVGDIVTFLEKQA